MVKHSRSERDLNFKLRLKENMDYNKEKLVEKAKKEDHRIYSETLHKQKIEMQKELGFVEITDNSQELIHTSFSNRPKNGLFKQKKEAHKLYSKALIIVMEKMAKKGRKEKAKA
ncbi:hypothetical protein QVD17_37972 [Tagetes erecta]|uniref:Uncharacterized protein n=1 Tax=Tagetes erecta TaxID=13708 RepID=A0AAD8NKI3_TARER|nr:hypothetical protein QVD17_37972 [Tagetes erecta]